jgi:DnaJ-class molecular chaperone
MKNMIGIDVKKIINFGPAVCMNCEGEGKYHNKAHASEGATCGVCDGVGRVLVAQPAIECIHCGGTGDVPGDLFCPDCFGTGWVLPLIEDRYLFDWDSAGDKNKIL